MKVTKNDPSAAAATEKACCRPDSVVLTWKSQVARAQHGSAEPVPQLGWFESGDARGTPAVENKRARTAWLSLSWPICEGSLHTTTNPVGCVATTGCAWSETV